MKKIIAAILIATMAFIPCLAHAVDNYTDITGLWKAYLADGESTLFLREDGTGSLSVGGAAYNLSWMKDNGSVTLDQGGAVVNGIYEENFISLAIGGGNLIFFRGLPEPLPLDSDLSGTWRAPMYGGDSFLTLNADGTAVLNLGPEAVNINWTHEGASVTLYQDGYPIECVFDGVFISIFLGEGSICFMPAA